MDADTSKPAGRHVWFAFPEDGGGWRAVPGKAMVVDGIYHKLEFPGFETHSGESFGVSTTVHVLEASFKDETGYYGHIQKVAFQNGEMASCVTVGGRERVVIWIA